MKKNNIIFGIILVAVFFGVISLIITGIVLAVSGKYSSIPLIVGSFSFIGIAALYLAGTLLTIKDSTSKNSEKDHNYYISLVDMAEENPIAFTKRLKVMNHLGDLYLILLFILIILSIVGIIALSITTGRFLGRMVAFLIALIVVAYIILKSIYIKPEEETLDLLKKEDYPLIFSIIETAANKTNAPKLHEVYVYAGSNCSVSSDPIGFGFKNKNVMHLGLDLLEILDEKELESIFIHEFAHIYNKDTLIASKAAINITRWQKIFEAAQNKGVVANLFLTKFAIYYYKLMRMHIMAIQKQREYIADGEVVKYTSKEIYFSASTKIMIFDYYINNSSADRERLDLRPYDTPPINYYNLMYDNFKKLYRKNKEQYYQQILKVISTKYDSHPSYKERMDKIGITEYQIDLDFERDTAIVTEVDKLISKFNLYWQKNALQSWGKYIKPYQEAKAIVENFKYTENEEKNLQYGFALEELLRMDEALDIYNQMLKKNPNSVGASYRIGIIKLNQNDIVGIYYLKKAIDIEPALIEKGLKEIDQFTQLNNLTELKEELREWTLEKIELLRKIDDENTKIRMSDTFRPVNLEAEKIATIKNKLTRIQSVKRAFLVTKELQYNEGNLVILGIKSTGKEIEDIDEIETILRDLKLHYFIIDLNTHFRFIKPFINVKGAEIYSSVRR